MDAEAIIAALGLQPHPEGGWYREIHRSTAAPANAPPSPRSTSC
jgi:predicted cupin superfamily sugar epimerase